MRAFSFVAALLLLAGALHAGFRSIGPVPPLGTLLDPVHGVWGSATAAALPADASGRIPGLGDSLTVVYDDRAVPHIRARSLDDAWRALGYVVARDRLFQLEMQARAGAGTLTELLGPDALPLDRQTRRLGMPRAAERNWASLPADNLARRASVAFAEGVNAWLAALPERAIPVEYRLLGRRPTRWEPVNTLHLFNRMSYTLSYMPTELDLLAVRAMVGDSAAHALFPAQAPIEEPIQPARAPMPRTTGERLPPPGAPAREAGHLAAVVRSFAPPGLTTAGRAGEPGDVTLGSNNWAVAPERSASGYALLAGDPHLELTLPSIWYEVRMQVPDTLDAYGVTIPGAPGIVIGFNRDVAWTFTNTGADVVDFWQETVDDSVAPRRYRLDGEWRDLELREEVYRGPDGAVLAVDTVRYTHRGPMRGVDGRWLSMRWTALDSADVTTPFLSAAFARDVADFQRLTRDLVAPAQNMLVADRAGTIAIRSTGRFPIRAGDGRGDVIRDGSASANDWQGWWEPDEYPQATRPAQGFLASANQDPFARDDAPRYLGVDWPTPWRALHINRLLRSDSAVTPDRMAAWQTDPGSARADRFVPILADAGRRSGDGEAARAAELLEAWDRRYTTDDSTAVLFEAVMRELARLTWDELRPEPDSRTPLPSDAMLALLLDDPESAWWDRRETEERERRDDILVEALRRGLATTIREHGEPGDERWRWGSVQRSNIRHLLRLEPFSRLGIPVQGGPGLLNPSSGSGTHGASWRMVVELSSPLRAWATYPGGQSGNPSSDRYDDRLAAWREGRLDTLRFPARLEELDGNRRRATLHLTPN